MLTTLILNTRYTFITDYTNFKDYIQNIKNNFTSDYADYAHFQYNMKNNSIPDYANYTDFRDCVCVCVCVCTSIHLEGFICLGLEVQGTDQRCCVEDVIFLCLVPSSILQYESLSLSN